jgi:hypothetical protein
VAVLTSARRQELHRRGLLLEWFTVAWNVIEGTSNGDRVSYDGVSVLEFEGDKVRRFMAYFDARRLTHQVVD